MLRVEMLVVLEVAVMPVGAWVVVAKGTTNRLVE